MDINTIIAIPPGSTIKEQLELRSMTQSEFSKRMDLSEKHISKLINGKVELTHTTALQLECVLGIDAYFWNNLENIYRTNLTLINNLNNINEEKEIVKSIPYKELENLNWIPKSDSIEEAIFNLRKFFEITNLKNIERVFDEGISFKVKEFNSDMYTMACVVQKAKLDSRNIVVSNINEKKLLDKLVDIKKLSLLEPNIFIPKLKNIFRDCGIVFIILPCFKNNYIQGCTFKYNKKIILSLPINKNADQFWVTLFHEIAHIIYSYIFTLEDIEKKCDEFAYDQLIDKKKYKEFCMTNITVDSIIKFAEINNTLPCIVLNKLKYNKVVDESFGLELNIEYKI